MWFGQPLAVLYVALASFTLANDTVANLTVANLAPAYLASTNSLLADLASTKLANLALAK